jgi:hypothetical protein
MKEHEHTHGHEYRHEINPSEKAPGQPSRTAELAQLGLLYVGIPAVTLYPLGFVGLGIQLWKDPFFPYRDFTTIWQAVALIEETVVIATGIRLIYLSLVATVLGVSIATLISDLMQRSSEPAYEQESSGRGGLRSFFWVIMLPVAALLIWTSVRFDERDDFLYLGAFLLFSIGGGALIGYTRVRRLDNWLIPGLAVAYAGAILASLCLAALQTPALPLVEIDLHSNAPPTECSESLSGKTYVKLSEGVFHWHLYNQEGLFAVPHGELERIVYKHCPEHLHRN